MQADQGKNYYDLLGLSPEASKHEIREAYREIARVFHPDSNFFDEIVEDELDPEQAEFFKKITEAYHILSDEDRRREYDEALPKGLVDWDTDRADIWSTTQEKMEVLARERRATGSYVFGDVRSDLERGMHSHQEVDSVANRRRKIERKKKLMMLLAGALIPMILIVIAVVAF